MTVPTPELGSCDFCKKRGLPLLLVRTAVAPAGAGAPLAADLEVPLAASAAHYTTRLLRHGYVFVYDEARKDWQIYVVNPQGYLFKVPAKGGKYTVPGTFNCTGAGHREVASCITVPDAANATKVWIGFSEVMWTQAVMNKHADEAYRRLHMVEINVADILDGKTVPHARPMKQLSAVVAEYAMKNDVARSVFDHSPFPPDPRFGMADSLNKVCDRVHPGKARIVTLPDPSAIAQEIALKMNRNAHTFVNHPSRQRQVIADQCIDSIERGVRFRSEKMIQAAAESVIAQDQAEFPHLRWQKKTMEFHEKIAHHTEAELQREADKDWARYARKFDGGARTKWREAHLEELKAYDARLIAPLARNHVAWLQSTALRHYFSCNFDSADAGSGIAYTKIFNDCTLSTQDKQACARLYDEWLDGSPGDQHNLLLRALTHNQQKVADAVHKVHVGNVDVRQIPWDNILSIHKESMGKLVTDAGNVAANLVANFMGTLTRAVAKLLRMDGLIDGKKRSAKSVLMGLGIVSGRAIIPVRLVGSHYAFVKMLAKHLKTATGTSIADDLLENAVRKALNQKGVTVKRVQGQDVWMAMPNKEFGAIPATISTPEATADWYASQINSVEHVEELDMARWKTVINTNFRFGVVAAVLQFACITKMASDYEKTLTNDSVEATGRLLTAFASFCVTATEIFGNVKAGRAAFSQGVPLPSIKNWALKVGRYGGLATGAIMAGFDIYHAIEEQRTGGDGMVVIAYLASAAVGLTLSILIFMSLISIPVIGLLVALIIGIGIWIESIKDNPVQDWLERCVWGKLTGERYKDLVTEQDQLVKATKD